MIKRVILHQWLIAVLILSATGSSALAQRTATATAGSLVADEANKTIRRASCVLMLRGSTRIQGAGNTPIADLTALTTAMTTTGLIDPAVKTTLGLGPREWQTVVRVEVTPVGAQAVKLSVSVDPGPNDLKQPEPADALMRELTSRAKGVIGQSVEPRRQETKARLDEIEKRRAELRATIESLRKRLRDAESANARVPQVDTPANHRRQLELELASKRPRLQAIQEILPRFAAQDELAAALKGLVAAREALVAGLEKAVEQGKADPLEVLRARADLAESRVRAADAIRAPGLQFGRSPRDERLSLEVDIASIEAQLKALPEKPAEPVKVPAEDVQTVRAELFQAEAENNSLQQSYQQARREYEQLGTPPTLVVLDGQPN